MSSFTKTMELTGFDEFDKKLSKLEQKVAKKIVKTATRNAIKLVLKVAKSNANRMVGGNMGRLIGKHTKIKVFKHQRRGSYGMRVGLATDVVEFAGLRQGSRTNVSFKRGKGTGSTKIHRTIGKSIGRWYIPAALEFGHGNAKPIPFMRSAYIKTRSAMIRKLGRELKQGIEREAKR